MSPFLQKFFQAFRARQQEPHSWSEVVVQSLDYVGLFATPWTAECQAFLPFTVSRSVLKLMSTEGQTLNLCKDKGGLNTEPGLRSPVFQVDSLPAEPPGKPKNTGMGRLSLLQGIFLIQELHWGLLHCRRILHQLSYKGSPKFSFTHYRFCALLIRPVFKIKIPWP